MDKKRFMISDAAKMVDVESHVLRYWEEELEINIPRNEMGHRYYTENDIKLLKKVKELKEKGYGLKIIRTLVKEMAEGKEITPPPLEETLEEAIVAKVTADEVTSSNMEQGKEEKMEQFKQILGGIVTQALKDNNLDLSQEVSTVVSEKVIKEMNYLAKLKDEQEEMRYKHLDETIRSYQQGRAQAAATEAPGQKKKKGFFRRKRKK